ncbi:MAG: stage III sporulation protein AF [Clostridia bacterium]|nr:stage III sporulation protein AF [Clostridia bacterium]
MQSVMAWVRQLVVFYILSNLFVSVLPNAEYKKYAKTFIGILLIMLVINPVISVFGQGRSLDSMLDMEMFNLSGSDTKMWMKLNDSSEYSSIIEPYTDEIKKDIDKKAWEYALYVNDCDIKIDTDKTSEDFGSITSVNVSLSSCRKDSSDIEVKKIDIWHEVQPDRVSSDNCAKLKEYISTRYGVNEDDVTVTLNN